MSKTHKYLCWISMVAALAACGGGGGGNAVEAPPVPAAWQGAQLVDVPGNNDSSDVDVALNATGVGHAVWSKRVNGIDSIFHARYVDGVWSEAQMIAGPGAATVATGKTPHVVALPNGDALAMWLDSARVMYSCTVNGQWQNLAEMQVGAGTLAHLRMSTDGGGRAVAIWHGGGDVFASDFAGCALQSGVVQISDNAVDADDEIDVAMDSSGRALAVWLEEVTPGDPTKKKVMSRAFTNGVWSFSSIQADSPINGDSLELAVAIDANGGAAAVWTEKFASGSVKLGGARGSGTTWGPPKTVSDTGFVVKAPDVAIGPDGQVMVVVARRELNAARFDVVARADITLGTLMAVEADDAGNAQAPQVAFDASGRAVAVWMQSDGTRTNVLFNRIDPATGQWGSPQKIESDDVGDALDGPALAVNANGRAMAAWQHRVTDADGVHAGVMANVFK